MRNFSKSAVGKLILLAFLLQAISLVKADGTLCNQVFNFDAYFSVNMLKQETRLSYKIYKTVASQGNFTYPIDGKFVDVLTDTSFNALGYDFVFNFCDYVKFFANETTVCGPQMSKLQKSYGMLIPLADDKGAYGNCDTIAPYYLTSDSKFEYYEFQLIDEDKPQTGFVYHIYYPKTRIIDVPSSVEGQPVTQKVQNYNSSVTYILKCESSQTENIKFEGWRYIKNETYEGFFFETTSKYGCPTLQISKLWQILSDNKIIFTIVMILIGTALCFFGLKIYNPTLFIVGYITGFGGIVAIMGEFVIRYDSESIMAYACLIIAVFFGVLTGYVTVSMPKLGFFALGMWLGVVLALLCNNAFLYKIQIGNQFVVLWVTIAILATSMGLLSCFFYKHCVMVCTGFIGSYCLIRPFGWILGDFPNELQIAKELKYGELTNVPNLFYLYFALILIIGVIGIRFQYSMYYSRRAHEEENDLQLYLADPDFVDLNKSLLDKDDEDLTTKEREIKKKLIRMQKNVEKEKKRQEQFIQKAEKLKRRERGEDVSDDSEDNEDNSDDDNEGRKSRSKSKDLGLFGALNKSESRRKSRTKSQLKKQNSNSSDENNKYENTSDHVVEKDNKKFSQMFAGIKKNKKMDEDEEDHGIEMDDMSENGHNDTKTKNNKGSDSENSDSEDEKSKKKNAKNAAKLAKSQKKKK